MWALAFNVQPIKAEPVTIVVPDDYATIQEAINNANEGDTIFVNAGLYYEHVVVNKTISLIGEDRSTTIVDGNGSGTVIECRDVTNVTISGFTIRNGEKGLDLTYSSSCQVADNQIINHIVCGITGGGIHFADNLILNNIISNCGSDGIRLGTGAQRVLIKGNVIVNVSHWWALVIDDSWEINVEENDISNTLGIRFYRSHDNIIRRNTISKSLCGSHAIVLVSSNDNVVERNMLSDNGGGLYVYGVNNTVYQNDIVGNNYGISIGKSDNTIYHNNFINNYYQVWLIDGLSVENQWDNGYPSGGNYWSDYTGVDVYHDASQNIAGSDGIGDTPYVIDANNSDHYPLMNPWTPTIKATVDFEPDTLNLRSKGKLVTCYIELPEGYNIANINVTTIKLNATVSAESKPTTIGDYDNDAIPDLMVKFDRTKVMKYIQNSVSETGKFVTVTLTITGKLNDGTPFQGSNTIRIIN